MSHTKGEWEAGKRGFWQQCVYAPNGTIIAKVKSGRYNTEFSGAINEDDEETIANARLIATAPELLEACKYVIKWHREHDSGSGELYGLDFVTTCINAVAKAEGR